MGRFVARRAIQSALLVFAIVTASFFLIHLTPGGPEAALISNPKIGPEAMQRMRERFGLNDPLLVQYGKWLRNALAFDFGRSYGYQIPVADVIGQRIWPTAQLGLFSYAVSLLGIPLGIYAAAHRGRLGDSIVRIATVVGSSLPGWWLGLTVIVALSSVFGWFPNGQGSSDPLDRLRHLVVPGLLLSLGGVIVFARFTRSEVLDVLALDYVRTARAKGLLERQVQVWHVFRNALIPIVTLLGYLLPGVLSGAVVTEYVFNWPGLGQLFYEAALTRDYPLLLGMLVLGTVLTIVGTLLADIGYGVVDPRVRYV